MTQLNEVIPTTGKLLIETIRDKYTLDFAAVGSNILKNMDYEYFNSYSYFKNLTSFALRHVDSTTKKLNFDKLADIIGQRYSDKWNSYWNAITLKYNIIENYSRVEEEVQNTEGQKDRTNSNKEKTKASATEQIANQENRNTTSNDSESLHDEVKQKNGSTNKTNTEDTVSGDSISTSKGKDTQQTNVFAFDDGSASGVPKETTTTSPEENRQKNERSKQNGKAENISDSFSLSSNSSNKLNSNNSNEKIENNTQNDHRENSEKETTETEGEKTYDKIVRKLTARGNIGVTTNTQMQVSYLEFIKEWHDFNKIIYSDIDGVLTLSVY